MTTFRGASQQFYVPVAEAGGGENQAPQIIESGDSPKESIYEQRIFSACSV
jgi:hypothetical protein